VIAARKATIAERTEMPSEASLLRGALPDHRRPGSQNFYRAAVVRRVIGSTGDRFQVVRDPEARQADRVVAPPSAC